MTIFVDTNVVIDLFGRDPRWFAWSSRQIVEAADGGVATSSVVVAELAKGFVSCGDVLRTLHELSIEPLALDTEPAFLAGIAFTRYRSMRGDGDDKRILPDFFIGAHALSLEMPLLTRDPRHYRTYFPDLTLITPETDA